MFDIFRKLKSCTFFFKKRACKLILAALLLFLGGGYFFLQPSSYYFRIPTHSDEYWGGVPLLQIGIEDKSYQVALDLGAKMSTLNQEKLNKIDKQFYGTLVSFDMHGRSYENPIYKVPEVKIHDLSLPMMKICEESSEFMRNNILRGNFNELACSGRMGRNIFKNRNFLLDSARSKMILCKDFKHLSKDGYQSEDFVKVPLLVNKIGFCLEIETDLGIKRFLLDTGSSISFFREPSLEEGFTLEPDEVLVWYSDKLMIGSENFGPQKFRIFNITSRISEIDGILGMDFLGKHAVFFDKGRLEAYIEK